MNFELQPRGRSDASRSEGVEESASEDGAGVPPRRMGSEMKPALSRDKRAIEVALGGDYRWLGEMGFLEAGKVHAKSGWT